MSRDPEAALAIEEAGTHESTKPPKLTAGVGGENSV
jgi:hypothetical protein